LASYLRGSCNLCVMEQWGGTYHAIPAWARSTAHRDLQRSVLFVFPVNFMLNHCWPKRYCGFTYVLGWLCVLRSQSTSLWKYSGEHLASFVSENWYIWTFFFASISVMAISVSEEYAAGCLLCTAQKIESVACV